MEQSFACCSLSLSACAWVIISASSTFFRALSTFHLFAPCSFRLFVHSNGLQAAWNRTTTTTFKLLSFQTDHQLGAVWTPPTIRPLFLLLFQKFCALTEKIPFLLPTTNTHKKSNRFFHCWLIGRKQVFAARRRFKRSLLQPFFLFSSFLFYFFMLLFHSNSTTTNTLTNQTNVSLISSTCARTRSI